MPERERLNDGSLRSSFHPRLPDHVLRLTFDSRRPGRRSVGDRALDRLSELLVVAGIRLLLLTLFVDLVTGDVLAITAFNTALVLPLVALVVYRRLSDRHGLGYPPLWRRALRWCRRRIYVPTLRFVRRWLRREEFDYERRRRFAQRRRNRRRRSKRL